MPLSAPEDSGQGGAGVHLRRAARSGFTLGAAIGLWWGSVAVAWLLLPMMFGANLYGGDLYTLLQWVMRKHLAWPVIADVYLPLLPVVGAVLFVPLVMSCVMLGEVLGIDRARESRQALAWAWRASWRCGAAFGFLALAIVLALAASPTLEDWIWQSVCLSGIFLLALAVPFVTNTRALLEGPPEAWRARWRWPGLAVVALATAVAVCSHSLDFWLEHQYSFGLRVALEVVLLPLSLWWSLAQVGMWIECGQGTRPTEVMRVSLDRHRIGVLLALEFRIGVGVLFVAPVVLAARIFAIYEWPQWRSSMGPSTPAIFDWIAWAAWPSLFVLAPALVFFLALSASRLWVRLQAGPVSPRSQA